MYWNDDTKYPSNIPERLNVTGKGTSYKCIKVYYWNDDTKYPSNIPERLNRLAKGLNVLISVLPLKAFSLIKIIYL